jgi:cobalt/nickel transport system permease protein
VFVAAFDRARRLEEGLALRGYDGALRVVTEPRPVSRPFLAGAVLLVAAVAAAGLVL